MKKEYDREKAGQLVPLLRSITREILERTKAIEALEATFDAVQMPMRSRRGAARDFRTQAEVANHRRELRRAKQELSRLGCALDSDHPLRILIPGEDGEMQGGYAWSVSDDEPHPISIAFSR